MKKLLSIFLSLVMMLTCIAGVDFTSSADSNDSFTYTDENGYQCTEPLPQKPAFGGVSLIGTTFIKLEFGMPYGDSADGIEVKIYDSSKKMYVHKKYLSYSATSYRACDLKKNTAYKFAVRAYVVRNNKKYYGKSIFISARTAPSAETYITSAKYISAGKMQIKWKKVADVSGYILKYSTSSSVSKSAATCTLVVPGAKNTSRTIAGLSKRKYYVKVCTYKYSNSYRYCSRYSSIKSVNIKKGVSMKRMLNAIKTDTSGKKEILKLTNKGVNISKYDTTYDRFKAIYNWHSKHNTDFGWSCMDCNINFNSCIAALFQNSNKTYDKYIYLAAGNFKNNDGSVVMHKWSVIYIAGTGYIFDPRLQGYTNNKTGSDYFGVSRSSKLGKCFLFDGWMFYWELAKDETKTSAYIIPSEVKPAKIKVKSISPIKGGFKLKWETVKSGKGYQIVYSTKKDFSNKTVVTVDGIKTASKTVKGLKSGKTYYVKIRAYKQYGKSKIYGTYSDTQKIKVK